MNNRQFQYAPRNFKQSGNNYRGGPMGRPRIPFNQRSFPPYMRPPFGMTPDGLCLPSHMQAPPMFGPRGPTIPPRMMGEYKQYSQSSTFPKNDFKQHSAPADNFWCETCDRGFKTSDILEKHKAEHQKCGIDGCQFIAHPNVVTKHIQMQHSSGLYNKIRNISTPEDVANWIKERKKNYPSKENIEKRRAQQKECHDRGEKLQPNKSRFNNRKNNDDRQYNKGPKGKDKPFSSFTKKNKNINQLPPKTSIENTASKKIEAAAAASVEELYCNLKRFRGTSELLRLDLINDDEKTVADDGIDIEDDEWQEVTVVPDLSNTKSSVCTALGNLINAYDSSSDDEPSSKKLITSNKEETCLEPTNSNLNSTLKISVEQVSNNVSVSDNKEISINKVPEDTYSNDVSCKDKALHEEKDSGPEETGIEKVDRIHNPDISHPQNQGRKRKHSRGIFDKNNEFNDNKSLPKKNENTARKIYEPKYFSKRAPNTLLEKLLETDIRHERNLVLQCIHYVIQNNYFMKK